MLEIPQYFKDALLFFNFSRRTILIIELLGDNQKSLIQERLIGESTRITQDILMESLIQKLLGLIILVDFKKAFDAISWEYFSKMFYFFNVGKSKDNFGYTQKYCKLDTFFSDTIHLNRGCRQ